MITKVKRLVDDALIPSYGYPGDAGMDLAVVGHHVLNPGESRDLPTGIAVELPPGHWARITGRSSTLRKRGLFVNEGVIDEGYRGELLVYVTNRQSTTVEIAPGDRLAQLIVAPVVQAPGWSVAELSESLRGTSGFGSTGTGGAVPLSALTSPGQRDVYLGGPIDYAEYDADGWRHIELWDGLDTYCPVCECRDLEDEDVIIQNERALREAKVAIVLLERNTHSVGSPIEAYLRVHTGKPTIIVQPKPHGVFVRHWARQSHVIMRNDLKGAAAMARSIIVGNPPV